MVNMKIRLSHLFDSAFGKTDQIRVLNTLATDGAFEFSSFGLFLCLFHGLNFNTKSAYLPTKCNRIETMVYSVIGILISVIYLILAISIHEFAHAFTADKLGDPTARSMGRLTLNPLAHIDPVGTVVLPLALMLLSGGSFAFGWGKPTPFDPYNLRNPRRDAGIISIAGPVSNLLLAAIVALVVHFLPFEVAVFLIPFVIINISLAVFNLIPVGPLDGQKIVLALLPRDLAYEFQVIMNRFGTLILIFLIFPFFGSSPVMAILDPAITFLTRLFLPGLNSF